MDLGHNWRVIYCAGRAVADPEPRIKEPALQSSGQPNIIAQIRVTDGHPLNGVKTYRWASTRNCARPRSDGCSACETSFLAGLLKRYSKRGDVLVVAATRPQLLSLLKTRPAISDAAYWLDIGGFSGTPTPPRRQVPSCCQKRDSRRVPAIDWAQY